MIESHPFVDDDTATIEVRVYRGDEVLLRRLCESEAAAKAEVDRWAEVEGVTCEVDDLSFRHSPDDILEPGPTELPDDEYPIDATRHWPV
jgi:hypothetical protein